MEGGGLAHRGAGLGRRGRAGDGEVMETLPALLKQLVDMDGSALHLTTGTPPQRFLRPWEAHSSASSPIVDDGVMG